MSTMARMRATMSTTRMLWKLPCAANRICHHHHAATGCCHLSETRGDHGGATLHCRPRWCRRLVSLVGVAKPVSFFSLCADLPLPVCQFRCRACCHPSRPPHRVACSRLRCCHCHCHCQRRCDGHRQIGHRVRQGRSSGTCRVGTDHSSWW